jgi:alkylated DNA repair protein alkB family protein 6
MSEMSNEHRFTRSMLSATLYALPPSCHYIPNFLTPAEEAHILSQIHATPSTRWTNLSHRRLLSVPSTLTGTARDTLLASPLPTYLSTPIASRFADLGIFQASPHGAPNHVLINEYQPGQGIMPHEDGLAYYPCTATVSLGAAIVLDVYEKNKGEREAAPRWRILQEPRSLLVTSGAVYTDTLHGIEGVMVDEEVGEGTIANWELLGEKWRYAALDGARYEREVRVSLTYRDVVKVAKVGGVMGFLGKR